MHTRQILMAAVAALALGPGAATLAAPPQPEVVMYKDPGCGCCGGWADHMRNSGFRVKEVLNSDMQAMKKKLGVPDRVASCHTAQVGGYLIEGHVPAKSVKRLLAEKPNVKGIAAPGMPLGSPGMDAGGRRDPFDVVSFRADGATRVFEQIR